MQIGLEVSELWSDKQTNKEKYTPNRDYNFVFIENCSGAESGIMNTVVDGLAGMIASAMGKKK